MYAIWEQARRDGALTPLGQDLGSDVIKVIRSNALLGYGKEGITTPGYSNMSSLGVEEQEQLAMRMVRRLGSFFIDLAAQRPGYKRRLMLVSSGFDRSTDSGLIFINALSAEMPGLEQLADRTPGINGYPSDKPQTQAAGTTRFLLRFHALGPDLDLVTDPADPYFETYRAARAYQAYLASPRYLNRIAEIENNPAYIAACRATLERIFTKGFIDKLEAGTYQFANTGSFTFESDDGQFFTTITGDGQAPVKGVSGVDHAL